MSIEAMKQMVEALENWKHVYQDEFDEFDQEALDAGRQAINEAEGRSIAEAEKQDQEIEQLIRERDHAHEIIDKLCDAVLGVDRYEWSSMYFFEDAVKEVEEKMAEEEKSEPVAVDKTTMELAESVGLIGPASRTNDLHGAIQRFHDLICVNATIKAAQMAADVIQNTSPPQRQPLLREQILNKAENCTDLLEFARAIEAAHGIGKKK